MQSSLIIGVRLPLPTFPTFKPSSLLPSGLPPWSLPAV
jgi:hypothetical protein